MCIRDRNIGDEVEYKKGGIIRRRAAEVLEKAIVLLEDMEAEGLDVYKRQGMLCCYEAKKRAGVTGKVIGLCHSQKSTERLQKLGFCDYVFSADATQPVPVMEKIAELTNGEMCDITIRCV